MRISDWSSDVCSSDLLPAHEAPEDAGAAGYQGEAPEEDGDHDDEDHDDGDHDDGDHGGDGDDRENGEAETLAAAGSDENAGNGAAAENGNGAGRSEEHTSELQSLMRISYAVFCLTKKQETDRT